MTGGKASAPFDVAGVTFDSREVGPGDLFVAMPGTAHDGHSFVAQAFASGAAGALVSQPGARKIGARTSWSRTSPTALTALAIAARERMQGTVLGVTGSVGKTSTKEALAAALERGAPGPGPQVGQELQQPHRRAAEPCPHAARRAHLPYSKWA